ncbi:glycoside hydrolase family 18 protein [Laetiporus sulphureus 93-53]|uniref:Glycoside hydrolase family 18 protein n=1 Tax=Laetiporus sulphureus 93-53 TaxID=1314785 RepID=A0A165I349_9APHY|nr:glycoside hydrolase family 18 protein [Laetiporus sulphureus 93-53]KZT12531.1 glycoside hydrolase family 18 protein [Laetiporus sulphureus 93-53]
MAYYPDWAAPAFPPEKVDFGRFDWIDFAFAVPDENFNLTWDGSSEAPDLLTRLVAAAHNSGTKVKLSVGGWTGSQYFSPAVSDDQSRQTLVSNIFATYTQFNLDGIDIDWEYPGQDGNAGNQVSPNDTANFLSFLQLLRATLPATAKLSAAVQTVPFADAQGDPLGNVSQFAEVLDWVLIMNYDAWGSSSTPGPNAPLSDACQNSTQASANAVAALEAWTDAGFPASQLVLGVPSYGYISKSRATRLRERRSRHARSRHSHLPKRMQSLLSDEAQNSAPPGTPPIYAMNGDGGTQNGQVQFRALVAQGVLQYAPPDVLDGNDGAAPTSLDVVGTEFDSLYDGWGGFTRYWDNCSSTPFLRSENAGQVVTYDDPLSLGLKAAFARESGMLGVNMFDVSGDTDQWDLTDALRKGLGFG